MGLRPRAIHALVMARDSENRPGLNLPSRSPPMTYYQHTVVPRV